MEYLKFERFKGKEILVNDLSGIDPGQVRVRTKAFENLVLSEKKKGLRVLSDIRGSNINTEATMELKRIASETKPYVYKYAVVGVSGIKEILFKAVKKLSTSNLYNFEDIEEAKEWLVRDD